MTLPYSKTSTVYRTVSVASEPNVAGIVSPTDGATYRTVSVPVSPVSQQVQYINGTLDGNAVYGGMRYLVPVQRGDSYMMVNQGAQVIPQQQMMTQQVLTPVYLQNVGMQNMGIQNMSMQNVGMQRISVGSVEDVVVENGNAPSVFSQTSSPAKSPEPVHQEQEEVVETVVQKVSRVEIKAELPEPEPTPKLDTRYFGELLAEVYRKNCDIHSCISEHVSKIRGRKHLLDSIDYKAEKQEVEALIPKGLSELTKQQIRYLLQTRLTADKTMRLLLTTFSSLREELLHMQEDLRRLESEKEELERDLSFKSDQALQYDRLIESLRDNNRQLQITLKETTSSQQSLETHLLSSRSGESSREFRIKELEGLKKALEQENEMLRQKMVGQLSSSTLSAKTEELSRQYTQNLNSLREEKDKELQTLRTQIIRIQTEHTTERTSDTSLQLRITELMATLEQRDSLVKRQEEEIKRLQEEKNSAAQNVTRTVITKRYRNQYPILGLLSDDYQYTSPVKEAKTIVIEKTGEMIKQE